jgi:hypothetical protein
MNNNEMSNNNNSSHETLNNNFLVPLTQKKIQTDGNKIHPLNDSTDQLPKDVWPDLNKVTTNLVSTQKLAGNRIKSLNTNASTSIDRVNLLAGLLDNSARPPSLKHNEDINKTCEKNNIDNNIMHQREIIEQKNASLSFLGKKVQRDSLCEILADYIYPGKDLNKMKMIIKELTKEVISEDNIKEKTRACLQQLQARMDADRLLTLLENTDTNNINLKNESLKDAVANCEKIPFDEANLRDNLKHYKQEAFQHELKGLRKCEANKKQNPISFETSENQPTEGDIPSATYCNMGLTSNDEIKVFNFNF